MSEPLVWKRNYHQAQMIDGTNLYDADATLRQERCSSSAYVEL
jgi:hypothetical protein